MTRTEINLIRDELKCIKGWIEHWETDRFCKLLPTETSLEYGKYHVDRVLALLDRAEAEHKEAA